VNFDMYRNLQRHRAVIPATARHGSCLTIKLGESTMESSKAVISTGGVVSGQGLVRWASVQWVMSVPRFRRRPRTEN